jgi:hypothetical protein
LTDKARRDAQLDVMKTTFDEYVDKRIKLLEDRRDFLKNILESRGATERVQNDVLNKLTAIAETDFEKLLTG